MCKLYNYGIGKNNVTPQVTQLEVVARFHPQENKKTLVCSCGKLCSFVFQTMNWPTELHYVRVSRHPEVPVEPHTRKTPLRENELQLIVDNIFPLTIKPSHQN